jgi:hypothetical protein
MVYAEVGMSEKYVDLWAPEVYDSVYAPLGWAKRNCPSYITNNAVQKNGDYYYRFYFGDEQDQLLFLLKWT